MSNPLLASLQPIQRATRGWIADLAWSPDGRLLACSSAGGVGVWRGSLAGRPAFIKGHDGPVKGVAFAPNGATLVTASADTTVKVWDLRAYAPDMTPVHTYTAFDNAVERSAVASNGTIVACGADGTVRALMPDGQATVCMTHDGEAGAVAVGGRTVASGGRDGTICLYDLVAGEVQSVTNAHTDWVRAVAFGADGERLLTSGRDGAAKVWDVTDPAAPTLLHTQQHSGDVRAASLSPDGTVAVTGTLEGEIHLWHTTDGLPIATLDAHTRPVVALAFHPSGVTLASGGGDNQLILWGLPQTT